MSMIKCTECGNDISDKATSCPHCGCPMDTILAADTEAKKKRSKSSIIIMLIGALVLISALLWFFFVKMPKDKAMSEYIAVVETYNAEVEIYNGLVDTYNTKVSGIDNANKKLDGVIADAQVVLEKDAIPYDQDTISRLSSAIADAESKKVDVPEDIEKLTVYDADTFLAENTDVENANILIEDELEKLTQLITDTESTNKQLVIPNYDKQIAEVTDAKEQYENSCAVQNQITYPTQEFVLEKLQGVENIAVIACVSEDNDVNGKLGTEGGYTAQIFFSSPLLKTENITEDELLEIGTDAGGSIEIYATVEDAKARDEYLASFDGSEYDTGKHTVLGTMIVRVSTNLTTTKQDVFSEAIIDALLKYSE